MNEHLIIETPENLQLQADVAGLGSRFLAALIDYALIFIVLFGLALLFPQTINDLDATQWGVAARLMISFFLLTFYHLFFELIWNGQTPGKRRIGIRVVQMNGLPAAPINIIIRNLVRLFDFLPLLYGFGLIMIFYTTYTQRLGDLAARTIVIYERPAIELHTVKQDLKVRYYRISAHSPVPADIDITALTEANRISIVNYLQRRDTLEKHHHLALQLGNKIAELMQHPKRFTYGPDAEVFLEWVARAFEIYR